MASTTTAQEIIDDAEELLQDPDNVHWDESEHLLALNNGSKEICMVLGGSNGIVLKMLSFVERR